MGFENRFEMNVFPKFVTISQFAILKAVFEIKIQGVKVDVPIIGKIVGKTVIASVAIAEKDKLRTIVEGYYFGLFIGTR